MSPPSFRRAIYAYFSRHRRDFPWRRTADRYKILVSEVMLQQTPARRVLPKYALFTKQFPNFSALSLAPLREVLLAWQGLGYNRRAKYVKEIAETVTTRYCRRLPRGVGELEKLPGVGPYSARAIATFAFGETHVFLETNIRTVMLHFFFKDRVHVCDREILKVVEETLDGKNPKEWYFALMDYGAMLKETIGNQNNRSVHYHKQSRFEGSRRELRGRILKELLKDKRIRLDDLILRTGRRRSDVSLKVEELIKEGLIAQRGKELVVV